MSSARNKNSRNDKTNNEFNLSDESIDDTTSVYMEERYTEVITRKIRGGKSWMVGCETFYTTKRTEHPNEEKRREPKTHNHSQDRKAGDFQRKDLVEANVLPRPAVNGGARPDVLVMKWRDLPVMADEKNSGEEKNEDSLAKGKNSVEGELNNSCTVAENRTTTDDVKSQDVILCPPDKRDCNPGKNSDPLAKNLPDNSRQKRRRSAYNRKSNPRENVPSSRSGDIRRGVRFSDDRQSEPGLEFGSTEEDFLELEIRKKSGADRRTNPADYSELNRPDEVDNCPREDRDGKYNINKKLSVENWLKDSMRYTTHDSFKFDIEGIDFIEVNRLPYVDSEPESVPKRKIGVQGGHSKSGSGYPNLYSAMFSSRDSTFREGPSGRGHFGRVFTDDDNEDFFLCASVFLFGHANLNSELRRVIDLFSQRLHVRYPRDSVGPVTAEERQILSFAALFTTKVEALVRMSSNEFYWKAFDPPGVSRPSRTLHLYYYASNYCDLIVKRELLDDFSWECD